MLYRSDRNSLRPMRRNSSGYLHLTLISLCSYSHIWGISLNVLRFHSELGPQTCGYIPYICTHKLAFFLNLRIHIFYVRVCEIGSAQVSLILQTSWYLKESKISKCKPNLIKSFSILCIYFLICVFHFVFESKFIVSN